jgi:Domain of unknown function (DUF1841)
MDDERRRFATPPATGEYLEIDLALLDPTDPDERRILIEAEHPELHTALESGREEIHLGGATINPGLHIAMHEVVANQLWEDNPPEVWQTAQRLLVAGYERHEVLHMLASVVSNDVFDILKTETRHDPDKTRTALDALPGSWEQRRDAIPAERHENRAERRAAARKHRRG